MPSHFFSLGTTHGSLVTRWFHDGTWTQGTDMPQTRRCHGVLTINDNTAMLAGGVGNYDLLSERDLKQVHLYDVGTDTYTRVADMNNGNSCPGLGLVKDEATNKDYVVAAGKHFRRNETQSLDTGGNQLCL